MSSNEARAGTAPAGPTAGMGRARSTLVWVLIVLAAVIGFASALTTWVNRQALDTTSWTKASADLINDPEVRAAVSTYAVGELYDDVDVSGEIAKGLPPSYQGLAGPISVALRNPAEQSVDRLLARPRVVGLWENANEAAHRQLVAILEDETRPGVSTANGSVTLDLRTMLIDLARQLGLSGDLVSELPADAGQITVFHSDQLSVAQSAVKAIRVLSVWLVVLVLVLWALALYLARGARRTTVRDIGWSVVAVGMLLLVVRRLGEDYVLDELTTPQTRPVGHHVWLIGTQLVGQIGWALIAYGIVAVLGAALAGPTRVGTGVRGWLAPTLNTRPGVVWGIVGGAYLLLILWGPTHALRTPLGILVLGVIAGLGVYGLRRQTVQEFPDAAPGDGPGLIARTGEWWGRHRHRTPHATTEAAPAAPASDEIERLHALHRAGALSDEEFTRGKERALA